MKKQILFIAPLLLFIACNKSNIESEMISTKDFYYTKNIQFIDNKTAYAFGNGEYEDNPEIKHNINNRTSYAIIFKSVDGGHSWSQIYKIINCSFYETTYLLNDKLYIKIYDMSITNNDWSSKILVFDFKTEKYKVINYKFDKMGCFWIFKNKLNVFCEQHGKLKIISFDTNYDSISSLDLNSTRIKTDACNVSGYNYVLTGANQLYDVDKNMHFSLSDRNYLQLARASDDELLLFSQDKEDDAKKVYIEKFNVKTKTIIPVCVYDGYTIIQEFKANNKMIVGFIGNIEGIFTSYDMIYSMDEGNTWSKYTLDDPNYFRPSCLIDTTMYVQSSFSRIQKLTFIR